LDLWIFSSSTCHFVWAPLAQRIRYKILLPFRKFGDTSPFGI
jgi:hypothetical protein